MSHNKLLDEETYSYESSRSSFNSDSHILQYEAYELYKNQNQNQLNHKFTTRFTSYFCTPRRCFRIFTIAMITIIVVFIGSLIKMSWDSTKRVESALKQQPTSPPIWESFPLYTRYYGGLKSIVDLKSNDPESSNSDINYSAKLREPPKRQIYTPSNLDPSIMQCFLDDENTMLPPDLEAFVGVPYGMPEPQIGSYDILGIRSDVCFDTFGKYGQHGYFEKDPAEDSILHLHLSRYSNNVRWDRAQRNCLKRNEKRFEKVIESKPVNHFANENTIGINSVSAGTDNVVKKSEESGETEQQKDEESRPISRKAVIIRTWNDYVYNPEDIIHLRSLITEISIQTGAEYTVHFLIEVKDNSIPIWADEGIYNEVLKKSLPKEFWGMGTLWSEKQMESIYNNLANNRLQEESSLHGSFRSHPMALTWFSYQHPEYKSIWQFEIDMRYTGSIYELLSKSFEWATAQPRKYIWERNSRFYIPKEHGTWEYFSHLTQTQTDHGTSSRSNLFTGLISDPEVPDSIRDEIAHKVENSVWGPLKPANDHNIDDSNDAIPPWSFEKDKFEWGVNEAPDLLVFNPIFDPHGTEWLYSDDMSGYNTSANIPRRASTTNFGLYSRKLLLQMHRDMIISGKHMFTEMFPASVALHHGFKAVSVPHPVFMDREWPILDKTFNGGRNGQSGGSRLSVFSHGLEHNFKGSTWYYNIVNEDDGMDLQFSSRLHQAWLGLDHHTQQLNESRMCLQSMMIHPIKNSDILKGYNIVETPWQRVEENM